jgi:serine/threonine protein kinase
MSAVQAASVEDKYEIVREIGSGGMSVVYEAKHKVINKRVAIKVLHSQLLHDWDATSRFLDEARAVASLAHPNIVDCSDIGTMANGAPCMVLEFLEGNTLYDEVDRGRLTVRRSMRIIDQIAAGLEAAHAQGIIHRDLKSENIFLVTRESNPDHPMILDFGISKMLAKPAENATRRGMVLGTPDFMAPEQLVTPGDVDQRIDIYALGVIWYHCLTGKYPFGPTDLPTLISRVMNDPPPPIGRTDVPESVSNLLSELLAKKREDRPETASEVRERIAAITLKMSTRNERLMQRLAHDATIPPSFPAGDDTLGDQPAPPRRSKAMPAAEALTERKTITGRDDVTTSGAPTPQPSQSNVAVASASAPTNGGGWRSKAPWLVAAAACLGAGAFVWSKQSSSTKTEPVVVAPAPTPSAIAIAPPITKPETVEPVIAKPTTTRVALVSSTKDVAVTFRGRTYRTGFDIVTALGTQPELIEVSAPKHKSRRYWVTIESETVLKTSLNQGFGMEDASAEETVVALGDAPTIEAAQTQIATNGSRGGKDAKRPTVTPTKKVPTIAVGSGSAMMPTDPVKPSVETVKPPVETVKPPVETVKPPVETVKPPVETVKPPVETVKPPVETVKPGTMNKGETLAAVRRQIGGANDCVERARMDNPAIAGKVVVILQIAGDGKVTGSSIKSSTLDNSGVDACIAGAVRRWTLPAPSGGVATSLAYPLNFQ